MAGSDKTVKVVFGVDEPSAAKAKRIISELTTEVKKFVEATKQADFSFGGGGGQGARAFNIPGRPGTSAGTQMQHQAGAGGLANNLTKAVTNSAALFKGAAQGSKDSFKVMSDALKQHVNSSDQEIRRLVTSLERLDKQYDKLKSRQLGGRGGALTEAAMSQVQGKYYGELETLDRVRGNRGKLVKAQGEMDTAMDVGGQNGIMGRARGAYSKFSTGLSEMGGSIAGRMGISPAVISMGVPIALAVAAVKAVDVVRSSSRESEMNNAKWETEKPFFRAQAQATLGQVYGGNALAIRHGDLARSIALTSAMKSPEMKELASQHMSDLLKMNRNLATPVGGRENTAALGLFGGAKHEAGRALGQITGSLFGSDKVQNHSADAIARAKLEFQQQTQKAEMMNDLVEKKIQSDPQFADRVNRLYSGAMGTIGAARAAGLSTGMISPWKNKPGVKMSDISWLEANAIGQGYDLSEAVGARQEMAQTVGRRAIGKGTFGLLSMKAGGLSNAAQLRSVGSQFGGGNYDTFMSTMQKGIGRGGLDVLAGAQIGGTVEQAMTTGAFQGEGPGFLRTMLDAAGGTTSDVRGAREAAMGLGALGGISSGGLDPYQQAVNASAAMRAAPGAPWAAQSAMMHADQATLLEFMKTKKVPKSLANAGVTSDMLSKYTKEIFGSSMFSRIPDKALGDTPEGQEIRKMRAAGGLDYLKKLKGPAKEEAILRLAGAAVHGKIAPNIGAALGMIRTVAGASGLRVGSATAKGAHETIKAGTAVVTAAGNQSLEVVKEQVQNAKDDQLIKTGIDNMIGNQSRLEDSRKAGMRATASGDPEFAVKQVDEALRAFVTAIKGVADGRPAARAAGAPAARK